MEYLTLEQVMELPNGTKVSHDIYGDDKIVFVKVNDTLTFENGRLQVFYKQMLIPKWYLV